jgi:hypothetical protein
MMVQKRRRADYGVAFMRWILPCLVVAGLSGAMPLAAQPFGHAGGPTPPNLDPFFDGLDEDAGQLEVLLSFGTSSGGSAGHLALAIKGPGGGDELVYSANFYADSKPEHAGGHYTDDLACVVPKREYLYGTRSSLSPDASFGLDYGEVYKRAVIGIRLHGVPEKDLAELRAFYQRLNRDYRRGAKKTRYHARPVRYDYLDLNCAKVVAVAFKYGLGWKDVEVRGEGLARYHLLDVLKANIPTATAMSIMEAARGRGWKIDVVLYKKYEESTYRGQAETSAVMFKDLPNRFPSVLSLDYKMGQGNYEDHDNLYAMHLLYNLGRRSVMVDPTSHALEVEVTKEPMVWDDATLAAEKSAAVESKALLRRLIFRAWGVRLGDEVDNTSLYGESKAAAEPRADEERPRGPAGNPG